MAGPTTIRPTGKALKRLTQLKKARFVVSDIYNLALEECLAKYKTSDELRAAIIAKKTAEYGA